MLTLQFNQSLMSEELENKTKTSSKRKIHWTNDKILSTSALFISVISLIALIYQSYLAREENKLIQMQQSASVLPHLNQWYSDYNNAFKFVVGNKGVGPAFIEDVKIDLDKTHTFNNTNDLFHYIFKNTKGLDTIPYITSTLIKGFVLPANEEINVLEVNGTENIKILKEALNTKDIVYKIKYRDVYGSEWLLSNENYNDRSETIPVSISN